MRRFALGFAGVTALAVVVAACSSSTATQTISIGPDFASQTLYAANSTQNAIGIYPSPAAKSGVGPQYQIGGTSTSLTGPRYLAFDNLSNLFVTNFQQSASTGSIVEIKASATGNVLAYNLSSLGSVNPRGIAVFPFSSTDSTQLIALSATNPNAGSGFQSQVEFFFASVLGTPYQTLAGPLTGLNVPSGVAVDAKQNIYVANQQGKNVEVFVLPTPSATPSTSPSPSPTPTVTPTASPSTSPSPTSSPTPTPTPLNIAPHAVISNGVGQPTGVALDSKGNIYVSDPSSTVCAPACPAVLIFPAGATGSSTPQFIAGSNTKLVAPTDVKVDNAGNVYVADSSGPGAGVVYVFASGSHGNVAPAETLTSPGTITGIALSP